MTALTPERVATLNVALNEATLLGLEVDPTTRRAAVTLNVLSLPDDTAPMPDDPRIRL